MSTDCTYRQSSVPKLIKGLGPDLHSTDLTAFTDRFPRKWQTAVIAAKYGSEVANLWEKVIAGRSFETSSGQVAYATGNPMGFLSSWPVSTFTHHAFMEWCAQKANKPKFRGYLMLGDDNICNSYEVSTTYQKCMTDIGVSISLSKSTQSKDGYAEFAKRLFTPQGEITGIPASILKDVRRQPEQLIELVRILRERGYEDVDILPGIQALTSKWRSRFVVSLVLCAPESVSGCSPLKGITPDSNPWIDPWSDGVAPIEECLAEARRTRFWAEVDKVAEYAQKGAYPVPSRGQRMDISEDHPMLASIGDKLMSTYLASEDEYSVYHRWMSGEDYDLAIVPNVDIYRYKNRGHRVTKAKYDIIKTTLKYFKEGLPDVTPERPMISNFELFQLGFPSG
jgi:hypothetical protein